MEYGIMSYKYTDVDKIKYNMLYTNNNFNIFCKNVDNIILGNIYSKNKLYAVFKINTSALLVTYDMLISNKICHMRINTRNVSKISLLPPFVVSQVPSMCTKRFLGIFKKYIDENFRFEILNNLLLCNEYFVYVKKLKNMSREELSFDYNMTFNDLEKRKYKMVNKLTKHKYNSLTMFPK